VIALTQLSRRLHGRRILLWALACVLTLCAAACSSSSHAAASGSSSTPDGSSTSGTDIPASGDPTAVTGDATSSDANASSGNATHAGSIDVCSLLSLADATAVAKQFDLGGDPAATYKLMAEKQPPPTTAYPSAACRFTIAQVTADNTGSEAIVTVGVQPAKYLDKTGTKISELGDEAYDEGPYVQVRVGDIILQSNENSGASKDFINAMYRLMAPKVS
jgi:hypothetical protein